MGGSLLLKYKHENTSDHFVSSIVPNATFPLSIKFKSGGFQASVLLRPLKEQCKRGREDIFPFKWQTILIRHSLGFYSVDYSVWVGALLNQPFGTSCSQSLGTAWQSQLGEPFPVHSVQQLKLSRQLVGLLPLGSKFGSFFVIVMVWKIFPCVGVKSKRPKSIQVDLFTYCWRKGVHKNTCAQPFGWQMFVFPVPVEQ